MNKLKGINQGMGSERYPLENLIKDRNRKYD
jgi:hypothetical protein